MFQTTINIRLRSRFYPQARPGLGGANGGSQALRPALYRT